jgi:hypothetical protein
MTQRTLFWILLLATLGYAFFMKEITTPLTGKEIVAFELAKTPDRARAILQGFANEMKIGLVEQSLYLDCVFLLLYGSALFVGCRYATELARQVGIQPGWVRIGNGLSWLGIVALLADAIENTALLRQLPPGTVTVVTAQVAWVMASLKFVSVIVVLLATLIAFGYFAIKRLSASTEHKVG